MGNLSGAESIIGVLLGAESVVVILSWADSGVGLLLGIESGAGEYSAAESFVAGLSWTACVMAGLTVVGNTVAGLSVCGELDLHVLAGGGSGPGSWEARTGRWERVLAGRGPRHRGVGQGEVHVEGGVVKFMDCRLENFTDLMES